MVNSVKAMAPGRSLNQLSEKRGKHLKHKELDERFTLNSVISSLRSCHKVSLMTQPFLSSFHLQTTLSVQITLNKDTKTFFFGESV